MNLSIRFKGFEASDNVKEYVESRCRKLEKFLPPTIKINANLEDKKMRKLVEINLRHRGSDYVASQASENLYTSIDDAVDKLLRQLSKAKDKKQSKGGIQKEVVMDLD